MAAVGVVAAAGLGVGLAAATGGGNAKAAVVHCVGPVKTIFDNTNRSGVHNGGRAPTFDTAGYTYCVTYIQTYHWNDGHGSAPGRVGLSRVSGSGASKVGPLSAQSSSGQNNARNVNWFADVGKNPPALIEGTYNCTDSNVGTWSYNVQSAGAGFCKVMGTATDAKRRGTGSAGATVGPLTATPPTTVPPQTLSMGPIQATFVPAAFSTEYASTPVEHAGLPLKQHWRLVLQLVDPAGAPDPGEPGSGAGVDPNCNNGGNISDNQVGFTWTHPDPANSSPPGMYGCDHSLMGPSGHQGRIIVTVTDGRWVCTAIYNGTNSGKGWPSQCAPLGAAKYTCQGPTVKIMDIFNTQKTTGGGRPPQFSTGGNPYCLVRVQTYHEKTSRTSSPGKVGLAQVPGTPQPVFFDVNGKPMGTATARVGPVLAKGGPTKGGDTNSWYADFGLVQPVVINGTYSCTDSDGSTWATNAKAKRAAFCTVYVQHAYPVV